MTRVNLFLVLLLVGLPVGEAWAQPELAEAARRYEEGLGAYYEGNFDTALESFLAAEKTGYQSGPLLYNIGNSYFRLNRLGMAIVYYERARRFMPTDDLLNHSARVAQRKTKNRFSRIPPQFWERYWDASVARIGPVWMYFVGLCFYLTAVVFLGVRIWTGSKNEWLRRGMALCWVAGIPFLGAAFIASHSGATHREAVVIDLQADLRESPSPDGTEGTRVYEGLIVDLLQRQGEWVQVRLPDGTTGWVAENVIEEV